MHWLVYPLSCQVVLSLQKRWAPSSIHFRLRVMETSGERLQLLFGGRGYIHVCRMKLHSQHKEFIPVSGLASGSKVLRDLSRSMGGRLSMSLRSKVIGAC